MLGFTIKLVDENEEPSKKTALLSAEKRSDQWSMLLVSVAETRDRHAFSQLFSHFAPLL